MILGKPTGISLKVHTENVLDELFLYLRKRRFVLEKYNTIIGKALDHSLELICKYHDLGKKHSTWQAACQSEFEEYKLTKKVSGRYLRHAKVRHEIFSLIFCKNNGVQLTPEELTAIGAHHGKLSVKHENKWKIWNNGSGEDFWKLFKSLSFEVENQDFQQWIVHSYRYDAVRAILQFADKRASAKEQHEPAPEYTNFQYTFNHSWQKRPVQKLAEENAGEDLLLLRAPTGAGKTDASLLWAYQQINILKRADRLIIALPTRFTSNALALNISDSIYDTGLYHSTSKFTDFNDVRLNAFSKLLETPVTVCTIDHLLISLSKTKEEHHHIFFNLSNSCLVIDEADFYDDFTQCNLLVLLEALQVLKVPILLMSASLPQASLTLYKKAGFKTSTIHEDTSDSKRERCNVREIRDYENFDEVKDLLEEATLKPSIIYVNTVDRAVKLKLWFMKKFPACDVTVYHSRFTEPDKAIKEEILLNNLGKKAWSQHKARGIAILTQIGEMSVNISADFMISEICPIDRLVQRVGRLSRFHVNKGELIILKPLKEGEIYPAPYGTFERNLWKPNTYLNETLKIIQTKSYTANDFVNMVNQVYNEETRFKDKSKENAVRLKELIKRNWLILPDFELEEGEESGYWKTRDITSQTTVLALTPDEISDYYNSYAEFEEMQITHGVTCPTYLVKKNLQEGKLVAKSISVRDDSERIFLLTSHQMYSTEYGLNLSLVNDEDQFL